MHSFCLSSRPLRLLVRLNHLWLYSPPSGPLFCGFWSLGDLSEPPIVLECESETGNVFPVCRVASKALVHKLLGKTRLTSSRRRRRL